MDDIHVFGTGFLPFTIEYLILYLVISYLIGLWEILHDNDNLQDR